MSTSDENKTYNRNDKTFWPWTLFLVEQWRLDSDTNAFEYRKSIAKKWQDLSQDERKNYIDRVASVEGQLDWSTVVSLIDPPVSHDMPPDYSPDIPAHLRQFPHTAMVYRTSYSADSENAWNNLRHLFYFNMDQTEFDADVTDEVTYVSDKTAFSEVDVSALVKKLTVDTLDFTQMGFTDGADGGEIKAIPFSASAFLATDKTWYDGMLRYYEFQGDDGSAVQKHVVPAGSISTFLSKMSGLGWAIDRCLEETGLNIYESDEDGSFEQWKNDLTKETEECLVDVMLKAKGGEDMASRDECEEHVETVLEEISALITEVDENGGNKLE